MHIVLVGSGKPLKKMADFLKKQENPLLCAIVDTDQSAESKEISEALKIPCFHGTNDWDKNLNFDLMVGLEQKDDQWIQDAQLAQNSSLALGRFVGRILQDLHQTKEDLDLQIWGMKKTNDAIKLLYKELEKKNKELQKLDQMKSDFISTVSHELRTPLTTIRETVSQIAEGILGPTTENQREFLNICKEDVDRLTRIINNLLDISKIEAGQIELKRELIDLKSLIHQIITSLQFKVEKKGLTLKSTLPTHEIRIYSDHDKLIQVFMNLINNALKFTHEGSIEISVLEKDDEFECQVSDTGMGITEEDLTKVFSKFQQFGRKHGAGEKGTGLGLSIAKGIVELHKGRIWVESEYGKGTQFVFTLPKYTPESFLKEILTQAIEDAQKKGTQVSLTIISLKGPGGKEAASTLTKTDLLKKAESTLNYALRQVKDTVITLHGKIVIALLYCDKDQAVKIEKRLRSAWIQQEEKENGIQNINLEFQWLTYPDDVIDVEEFFEHIDQCKVQAKNKL
ncbi:HAMP domain-containing histidine kinase [PVC group bacterium]|nr:HAMP domain-containing histidine kinase [PVC group bacterium]